ncbi:anti-virulence regulator CigR family protein [Halomonas sp. H10-9-1]|uniref:anti-virulence regulator CigR family protein n=1 Tax=Halomonas sp. H10-9-1 TaxID=2950871 RepID=UPI0032DF2CE3
MSKRIDLRTVMAASGLALLMVAGPTLAQPADNPGRGQGQGQEQRKAAPGQQRQQQEVRERRDHDYRDRERRDYNDHRDYGERRDYRDGDRPIIDERDLRRLFGVRHDWVREDERAGLPPGIRMNLERGKPLPPGIAKRFDARVLRDLPHYDGYEWRRVGPDAILVDAANEIIYRVIRDVLY